MGVCPVGVSPAPHVACTFPSFSAFRVGRDPDDTHRRLVHPEPSEPDDGEPLTIDVERFTDEDEVREILAESIANLNEVRSRIEAGPFRSSRERASLANRPKASRRRPPRDQTPFRPPRDRRRASGHRPTFPVRM